MALSSCLRLMGHCLVKRQAFSGVASGGVCRLTTKKDGQAKRSQKKQRRTVPNLSGPDSSWEERLSDSVTPLWRLGYEAQLKIKFAQQKNVLQRLASRLKELSKDQVEMTRTLEELCCPLHPVLPSCYEEMVRQSPLNPCLLFHEGGHWREITVRTNRDGHTMAIITFHPQKLSQEELCAQKASVRDFFMHGPGAECNLTSLYFQESSMTRCTHEQSPYQLLYGEPHIFEELLGLKFRISPDAFFQISTAGAEVLYRTIAELSKVKGNTVLFDICCGTGAIGLSVARQVSKVFGIELVEKAIDDAKWNASFNGISNCQFYSGKAEVVLPQLLSSLEEEHPLTAVVNPSRAGLHYRVVQAIRNCKLIQTLVYVSCKPDGEAMRNFIELCCPPDAQKKILGEPFALTQAVPVDLFPHTPHCELVLLFER
ncbi:tRNA (uracil(54)-C(5))-methyltransferase homolog isoform X2 [Rhinatrema bivittatum]|uniref:tRNA (uracil(54)-C(5))-methyltransferase homolog isoform X2 n=1 Tax=Rhinatrema bivittatum TaxID=194408 RepID=UPI00112D97F2|nr:tRNA (uracil(54)-C(5))-methyltransferase homolog isoform X2 [Rhinatrema bivittatum]